MTARPRSGQVSSANSSAAAEAGRLWNFARGARVSGGFAWLDDNGQPTSRDLELWITCRMTHVAALAEITGQSGWTSMVDHGVRSLTEVFQDHKHGGWYAAVDHRAYTPTMPEKQGYGHAFVILAASSATLANRPGAAELLAESLVIHDQHFWDEETQLPREAFDVSFSAGEDYRGTNAAMHTVEAYLAATDATGDLQWLERAEAIATWVVNQWARERHWRVPEHFTADWQFLPEYHRDQPAHPFRPYGATIGHALEWSRLILGIRQALRHRGKPAPAWIVPAAEHLAEQAVIDGWAADGSDGFIYTTDWSGKPVVRQRMHWVVAEALAAAVALHHVTGDERWSRRHHQWWDYAKRYVLDHQDGSWHHELSPDQRPTSVTWSGKPDIYHALQAMLALRVPAAPSFAGALRSSASS
ncbi:MAG: AGE family epimerase/isomerase [Actinomycetota bacterium]